MEHKCTLKNEEITVQKECKWYQRYILISPDNPQRFSYFRSNVSVQEEQIRQLKISKCVIHPFSKFRGWYEMFLVYLYASALITKPIDAGFIKTVDCSEFTAYICYSLIVDLFCWVDIILYFVTGYEHKRRKVIELRKWNIAKNYILSPFFICDILSSIPKCLIYAITQTYEIKRAWRMGVAGFTSVLGLFKAVRIVSFVRYIWKTADFFQFQFRVLIFIISTMFGSLMIIHWLTCMQFAVSRLYRINFSNRIQNVSWFYTSNIYNGTLYTQESIFVRYNHCLLKCSGYILGIPLLFYPVALPEEYLLAMFTYFIGKFLLAFIWIILTVTILNSRIMEIKFAEIMNQLHEYMKQKQLPLNLRSRILQHFDFKYRNRFFQEELIIGLLSENLRKEVQVHTCKPLIDNIPLFRELSTMEVTKVVRYLIPEIFLPNDTIIQTGTRGDAMYFLASGTVVVYTHSGKEICHLQDGAYFGEISLVMKDQLRSATVKALETSHVYKLHRKNLERHLLSNKSVMIKVLRNAEERLKEATILEKKYKERLLQQALGEIPLHLLK